jgi:hypothetical protein
MRAAGRRVGDLVRPALWPWVVIGLLTSGCGEGYRSAPVGGTVVYQGRPVPGLLVQFQHRDGLAKGWPVASGFTDAEGRYSLARPMGKAGAIVGPNTATLSSMGGEGGGGGSLPADLTGRSFPFEVTAGENRCDIDLGPAQP